MWDMYLVKTLANGDLDTSFGELDMETGLKKGYVTFGNPGSYDQV
jgi:hypothetical protein